MRAYLTIPPGPPPLRRSDERTTGADALVLATAGDFAHVIARIAAFRTSAAGSEIYVCVGEVDGPTIGEALAATMPAAPTGLVLPATHGRDVTHLGARLAVFEAANGLPDGSTRIVASVASATGAMNAPSFRSASRRLSGLTWDPGALASELGAVDVLDRGDWIAPLAQVRATLRIAAAAAGVEAIEAPCPADDEAHLSRHLAAARRDAFDAVLLTKPTQIGLLRSTEGAIAHR